MEFLYELGLFATQTLLIVLGIIAIILVIAASAGQKNKGADEGFIEVRSINDRFDRYTAAIRELSDTEELAKERTKLDKKAEKERAKADKARAKDVIKAAEKTSDIKSERPRTFLVCGTVFMVLVSLVRGHEFIIDPTVTYLGRLPGWL